MPKMTSDEITGAIQSAATASGITTTQELTAMLAGSFATSLAIQASGVTVEQLTDLLKKGQLPAQVADLEKQIREVEKEKAAAESEFHARIIALRAEIETLKQR